MKHDEPASIMRPEQSALEGRHVLNDAILTKGQRYYIYEKTEYPAKGGIFVYYKGKPFPTKGYPFPEAVYANDNLKRVTRFLVSLFSGKQMILPLITFAILPWRFKLKKLEQVVDEYLRIAVWLQNESYLKAERYSAPSKEIGGFFYEFFIALGMDEKMHYIKSDAGEHMGMKRVRPMGADPVWVTMLDNRQSFVWGIARTIATIFEYDDSYRYRLEDIVSESSRHELLFNTRKEIGRLTEIFMAREKTHATIMIGRLSSLVRLALLHPKIEKAFKDAIKTVNFERLGLDNADRYHVLPREDYDFVGRSLEDRKRIYLEFHMLSKCHKKSVRLTKDKDANTVGGKCTECWQELAPKDVEFDLPPMMEVTQS